MFPSINVFGHAVLEHFEVNIVGASSSIGLLEWLRQYGYTVNRESKSVLKKYIDDGWAFVAVKLNPGMRRRYDNEFLPPLTIRYKDDRIVFPLKISFFIIAESTVSSLNLPTRPLMLREHARWYSEPEESLEKAIRDTGLNNRLFV